MNRLENQDNMLTQVNICLTKWQKYTFEKEKIFSKWCFGNWIAICRRVSLDLILSYCKHLDTARQPARWTDTHTQTRSNPKWIKILNRRLKSMKLLKEKVVYSQR